MSNPAERSTPTSHHAGLEVFLVGVHVLPEADQHGDVLPQCGGRLFGTGEPGTAAEVVQTRVVDPLTQRHFTLRPGVEKGACAYILISVTLY